MSVTNVDEDLDTLTLTLIADFAAPRERVWQLWADPRQLERWWGPPGAPATFEDHDLTAGGQATYYMTGSEGERYHGWWRVTAVDAPASIELVDGFADDAGTPVDTMPTTNVTMTLTDTDGGTRMELRTVFDSREDMERLDQMGMTEGLALAVGQMDELLA